MKLARRFVSVKIDERRFRVESIRSIIELDVSLLLLLLLSR